MQNTPQSWGRVYWSGGAGKVGEMGGWRYHCNFCDVGNLLTSFGRKSFADDALAKHSVEKHSNKTEVRALMAAEERTADLIEQMREKGITIDMQSTTGAAKVEAPPKRGSEWKVLTDMNKGEEW